jgi:hypothetical protein
MSQSKPKASNQSRRISVELPTASATNLRLSWYRDPSMRLEVRPSPQTREWMDAIQERFAYRCLPLNIANAHSWEILNPITFYAIWNGGDSRSDITIFCDDAEGVPNAKSHFGYGLLSFPLEGLIRTEPGFDLWVTGPINRPKPSIQPLSAMIETDWSMHGLTMIWKFTHANELVRFEQGEPFCSFFPIQRGVIERFDPQHCRPEDDEVAWRENRSLRENRLKWNERVQIPGTEENQKVWQRSYLRGPEEPVDPPRRMKVRLKPFKSED